MTEVARFKQAMRRVSSAVTIVTTRGPGGERRGVTATAVCSLSADPPSLLVCVNRETWVARMAPLSGVFCVNVLARHHQPVAETFAGRTGHAAEERFEVGDWRGAAASAPALEDALAAFDCRLARCVDFASHVILIGEVASVSLGAGDAAPLVYVDGAFGTSLVQS